ncbi:MAG: thiol reductant ABC exporter subunit CydC [Roseibium sp.]|nr:thiol reductant ABC exporter subunit CydC [Roseibium sp.]
MSPLGQIVRWQWAQNRVTFVLGILAALVPALAGLALLGVAGWFITAAALAGFTGVFLNIFVPSALIRALALLRTAGRYAERLVTHDATFRFLTDLRSRVFAGLAVRAMDGPRAARSGLSLNRLVSDVAALDAVYLRMVVPLALAGASALLVAIVFVFAAPSALVPLLVFGGALGVLGLALHRASRTRDARLQEAALDAVRVRTVDLVAGRRDLAVYGGTGPAADRIISAAETLRATERRLDARANWLSAATFLLGQIFAVGLLCVLAFAVATGDVALPIAAGLVLMALALPEVMAGVLPGMVLLPRTKLAAKRVVASASEADRFDSAAQKPGLADRPARPGSTAVLTFKNVSFAYPAAQKAVVSDLSFDLGPGETLALTGRSGCGKSTVSALGAGLFKPLSGSVLLMGRDLTHWAETDIRTAVTVLGQRPYLFQDTVAANLRIARPEATDAMLWEALEAAALVGRIRSGSMGLETLLGEDGLGLSGGEQRRLGLARAYLTRPRLWILDEMTEGLDRQTAEDVLDRFFAFRGEAAVLMVAHKAQEVVRADRVLRMSEGGGLVVAN